VAKTARRQAGEGSLHFRKDKGLWVGTVTLPERDGKRRRRQVTSTDYKVAKTKLDDLKAKLITAGDLPTADTALAAWLRTWLEEIARPRVRPKSYERYRDAVVGHLIPELGKVRIEHLTLAHIRQLHARFDRLGLSESSARSAHTVLSAALTDAVREDHASRNVAKLVKLPRVADVDTTKGIALSMEEVRRFMAIAEQRNPRTASRWVAAFLYGPRQGETLGLRWPFVNLDEGWVDIAWQLQRLGFRHGCGDTPCGRKRAADCPAAERDVPRGHTATQLYGGLCLTAPKNARHRIPIPAPLHQALTERRRQVDAERAGYVSDHQLVWCRLDGEPISLEDDYDEWVDWLSAAEIPHRKLHAARHTAASLLRALGYHSDVIRMILGHTDANMTQRYTEMDLSLAREALTGYGDALGIGQSQQP
jgi:integrase